MTTKQTSLALIEKKMLVKTDYKVLRNKHQFYGPKNNEIKVLWRLGSLNSFPKEVIKVIAYFKTQQKHRNFILSLLK